MPGHDDRQSVRLSCSFGSNRPASDSPAPRADHRFEIPRIHGLIDYERRGRCNGVFSVAMRCVAKEKSTHSD